MRTRSIMTFRLAGHDMDHLDMGGPLIFMALLGAAHLLVRMQTEGPTFLLWGDSKCLGQGTKQSPGPFGSCHLCRQHSL